MPSVQPHSSAPSGSPQPTWHGHPNGRDWKVWQAQQILAIGTAFSKHTASGRKHRARAERVVGQFLAIRDSLKKAEADAGEIDDLDEIAAQLTVAAFKPAK
ncbi:protein of unknown function (plasmid) [Aminobacter niigataensis]|nr:protein of unknown function [Aminobacter niigataensis]CAI2936781.1 protein of unknown function [Aminobacter niigataensis]